VDDFKDHIFEQLRRNRERQDDLELERQKKEIRELSYALVWMGTADELTATITRWFESGWIVAPSLSDALQMASFHFADPNGNPVILPAVLASPSHTSRFSPMDEHYQVVEFEGKPYDLTPYESIIIRALHKAHIEKRGSLGIAEICKALGVPGGKMSDWFRGDNKPLKSLILHTGRQHYRLDL
jgi:hypothetical protein